MSQCSSCRGEANCRPGAMLCDRCASELDGMFGKLADEEAANFLAFIDPRGRVEAATYATSPLAALPRNGDKVICTFQGGPRDGEEMELPVSKWLSMVGITMFRNDVPGSLRSYYERQGTDLVFAHYEDAGSDVTPDVVAFDTSIDFDAFD